MYVRLLTAFSFTCRRFIVSPTLCHFCRSVFQADSKHKEREEDTEEKAGEGKKSAMSLAHLGDRPGETNVALLYSYLRPLSPSTLYLLSSQIVPKKTGEAKTEIQSESMCADEVRLILKGVTLSVSNTLSNKHSPPSSASERIEMLKTLVPKDHVTALQGMSV